MRKFLLNIILFVQIIAPVNVGGSGLPYKYMVDKINSYNDALDAQIQLIENEQLKKAIIVDKQNKLKKIEYQITRYIRVADKKLKWNNYTRVISGLESSHRYDVVNQFGYLGKYQISHKYLENFGFDGTRNEFLSDKLAQELVMANYTYNNIRYIKKYNLNRFIGKDINGIKVTVFGMMASAHLVGIKSLTDYLNTNGKIIRKDGNDTSIEKYMKVFS